MVALVFRLMVVAAILGAATSVRAAGNVTGAVTGGSLVLTGDAGDDVIAIDAVDADSLRVTPTAPTTLNGAGAAVTFDAVTKDVVLMLGIGANQTTLTSVVVPGMLVAKGGAGSDVIVATTSGFGAGVKLDLGAGVNVVTLDTD